MGWGHYVAVTWVCFDCREAARDVSYRKCPHCQKFMYGLRREARIPKKDAPQAEWEFMRKSYREGMFSEKPKKPKGGLTRKRYLW